MYILWNDYHNKFGYHPSPYIITNFFLPMMRTLKIHCLNSPYKYTVLKQGRRVKCSLIALSVRSLDNVPPFHLFFLDGTFNICWGHSTNVTEYKLYISISWSIISLGLKVFSFYQEFPFQLCLLLQLTIYFQVVFEKF